MISRLLLRVVESASMVDSPTMSPVARPLSSVSTLGRELRQTTVAVTSCVVLSLRCEIAWNCAVLPGATVRGPMISSKTSYGPAGGWPLCVMRLGVVGVRLHDAITIAAAVVAIAMGASRMSSPVI
jgi:hypothetical protein